MDLIEELHDLGDAGLHVGVASHVGGARVAAGVARVVAVAALAGGQPKARRENS